MNNSKKSLTTIEKKLLLEFLNELSDKFGNAGCNDYSLPNDAAHRQFMEKVIKHGFSGDDQKEQLEMIFDIPKKSSKLCTMDITVLDYLKSCVEQLSTEEL